MNDIDKSKVKENIKQRIKEKESEWLRERISSLSIDNGHLMEHYEDVVIEEAVAVYREELSKAYGLLDKAIFYIRDKQGWNKHRQPFFAFGVLSAFENILGIPEREYSDPSDVEARLPQLISVIKVMKDNNLPEADKGVRALLAGEEKEDG